jgi:hypothetical protein
MYIRHLVEKDPSLMCVVMLAQAGPLSLANRLLGKESITNYWRECLVARRQPFKYRSI